MSKPILILKTGSPYAALRRRQGDFVDWVKMRMGGVHIQTIVVDAPAGDILPSPETVCAVIITGSHAMVTERRGWSETCAAWLAGAVQGGVPVLGICYGHQLLAYALGGDVSPNPNGREFGTVEISLNRTAQGDALFSTMPERFLAQVCHTQSVARLPEGAVVLGASERDGAQAVRFGEYVWGVQFHPEFDAEAMRFYLKMYQKRLEGEGQDVRRLLEGVRETPESENLIRTFCKLVQEKV